MVKTYADWKGDLQDYLRVGDKVDEEMENYFLNVLPPATDTGHLIQMGEPYSHIDGKATYATLEKIEGHWTFKGHCFRGESDSPLRDEQFRQFQKLSTVQKRRMFPRLYGYLQGIEDVKGEVTATEVLDQLHEWVIDFQKEGKE